jgi:outer membrane protein assembly factor BamB
MDGNVKAYSAEDGKEYFSVSVGSEVTGAPVVAGDYLYLATKKGELMILDRYSGELLDQFVTGGEINASPVVAEGVIYIGSSDGNMYALTGSTDQ